MMPSSQTIFDSNQITSESFTSLRRSQHPMTHKLFSKVFPTPKAKTKEKTAPQATIQTETQKLDTLIGKTHHKLFEARTVFPFDLFPNKIAIDENKVDVEFHDFFLMKRAYTILIKNINGVNVYNSVIFASLNIEVTGYETNPPVLRFLFKKDAECTREIIMGLVAAYKENIDLSLIPQNQLVTKIIEVGKSTTT